MFMNLWKLSEGGEGISLTNNATIFPVGIAEGVFRNETVSIIIFNVLFSYWHHFLEQLK
jgi:hypothetical protein